MTDPYGVLGVRSDASDEEIAKAYKKLAKRYHPDLNPGNAAAAQRMGQINQAYDEIKTMRQSGNRQNSRPADSRTAYSDPFDMYRDIYSRYSGRTYTYEEYRRYQQADRRSTPLRFGLAIILALLLLRFLGILLAGTAPVQRFLYGSDEPAYGYYQYYGNNPGSP